MNYFDKKRNQLMVDNFAYFWNLVCVRELSVSKEDLAKAVEDLYNSLNDAIECFFKDELSYGITGKKHVNQEIVDAKLRLKKNFDKIKSFGIDGISLVLSFIEYDCEWRTYKANELINKLATIAEEIDKYHNLKIKSEDMDSFNEAYDELTHNALQLGNTIFENSRKRKGEACNIEQMINSFVTSANSNVQELIRVGLPEELIQNWVTTTIEWIVVRSPLIRLANDF